ncbi:MBL fold metallo-hydrolase [Parasediminibacterium sp. JCM 36343]|uniref:MBL fold metallo-hydrolase n=1 Tax=Parasediminibacterium sp. JCM 36343 TaxID=3374279 RepID=UPI00397C0F47
MIIILVLVAMFGLAIWAYTSKDIFGKTPSGAYLEYIKQSPHYNGKKFLNLSHTPDITEGVSYFQVLRSFLLEKSKRLKPASTLPSQKTDLFKLNPEENILVWFGHSSYFMQVDGRKILVDPVFSGNASPIPGSMKSFPGSDVYTPADIPEIDYLFISHDHWDHLDYSTVIQLEHKVKTVITGLGTSLHLKQWGYPAEKIIEKDWYQEIFLEPGFVVNTLPARHFSGRGLTKRQQSLWMSFALKTPTMNIFIGGDSGYDTHFASIGQQFGPFDLAILECGQYNKNWRYIHSMPEEVAQAAKELKAKRLLPVHWAKFPLAQHDWDEPIIKISAFGKAQNIPVITPMIGEAVFLQDDTQSFSKWWEDI